MRRAIAVFLMYVLGGSCLSAQSFDEFKAKVLEGFSEFRSKTESDFNEYRRNVNSEFAQFMRQAWTRYEGQPAVSRPPEIPDVPPVVLPDLEDPEIPDNEVPFTDVIPFDFEDIPPVPLLSLPDEQETMESPVSDMLSVTFYGTDCMLRFDLDDRVWLADVSERSAADMWERMCCEEYDALLSDCLKISKDMNLCDWAYYKFAQTVAEVIYGKSDESVMLAAFIMNQSGFRIKLGRCERRFHLLIGVKDGIYGYPCYTVNGYDYYLTDGSDADALYIFDRDFPNERSLRMAISKRQGFAYSHSGHRKFLAEGIPLVEVDVNMNMVDFYADYPHPYKKGEMPASWAFYAEAPMSDHLESALLEPLSYAISGRTQEDSTNMLINFVQTAFEYQTDELQWGYERPFFPEETLYYPFSDCEDRAILFSCLIRELLGLDVVFLYYPGHLATAVRFDENVSGDYVMVGGEKYLVCDPTYINAPVGRQMPGLDVENVKVIKIRQTL